MGKIARSTLDNNITGPKAILGDAEGILDGLEEMLARAAAAHAHTHHLASEAGSADEATCVKFTESIGQALDDVAILRRHLVSLGLVVVDEAHAGEVQ